MDRRIFHGNLKPADIARTLIAQFNRGNLRVQQVGSGDHIAVQIATAQHPASGGQTALSVHIQQFEDGVTVEVGEQTWLGVAASLGVSALSAWRNPFGLLNRLDDIAQDIEYLQLTDEIWKTVNTAVASMGAGAELSERLRRVTCDYCGTANPVGEPSCIACGAPLGEVQPFTCSNCGYVYTVKTSICKNCGKPL